MNTNRRGFMGFTAGALVLAASPPVLALPPARIKSAAQLRAEARDRETLARIRELIKEAGRLSVFNLNDNFTRHQAGVFIQSGLEDLKQQLKIYDYKVVIDATNNPPNIILENDMAIDVYVKPSRSPNYFHWSYSVKYENFCTKKMIF
jgi:hypothetical protein